MLHAERALEVLLRGGGAGGREVHRADFLARCGVVVFTLPNDECRNRQRYR